MVALGPRVGGAHVDVNLKFDDSSLDSLANRIKSQLAKIGASNRSAYQSIGRDAVVAWRGALGAILAGAPLIGSAISAASGAITTLAGSLYSLGQSSYALLPIFTSLGFAGLTLGIGMRGFSDAVSEVDPKRLALLLADMPPAMQSAVLSTRKLSKEMRAAVFPKLFAGISDGVEKLRGTGVLSRGLGAMADSLNGVARSALKYAGTKGGISTINKFFQNNAKVFAALGKAVVPFLDAFLRLTNALVPSALRLAGHITDLAKSFQKTTKSPGYVQRIDEMMKKAEKTAGKLIKVFVNLFSALGNVFGASNKSTNGFLDTLIKVTRQFKNFTGSVKGQKAIATWAANSVTVARQFGRTIAAVFKVIAKLSDSKVILSFLKTLQVAFDDLNKLPLDKFVTAFLKVADILRPISGALLAIIAASAAFNIFIGSLIGQIAGVFGILGTIKKFKTPFGKIGTEAGKNAEKVGKFTGVFKSLGSILGKALKFAGFIGIAVYIGVLISKSKKLQDKVKEAFQAFKDLAKPLKKAFQEISTALGPVSKDLKPVFDAMDKIASLAIGVVIDTITGAFKALGKVITGAGRIIAGILILFDGLFHLDGGKMLEGLKKIGSGIKPLLSGLLTLFIDFFAPAKFLKLGGLAFKELFKGLKGAGPGILGFIRRMVDDILLRLMYLGPSLLRLGGRAISGLGRAISKNAPKVLKSTGHIVAGVLRWIGRLPGRLVTLGRNAITKMSEGVSSAAPKVLKRAGEIVSGVVKWIAKLPGRLFHLGKDALLKLGRAEREGLSKVVKGAKDIFKGIWGEVKSLPGDLLKLGSAMIGGLINGITAKFGALKKKMGDIGGAIKNFLPGSPVKEGPLKAWNYSGGATGGGRKLIAAITGGLENTDPIRKAMEGVASAVSSSLVPTVGNLKHPQHTRSNATEHAPTGAGGGNVYIAKMSPHNYGEFERQMREKNRQASLGGRKPSAA